MATRHNELYGKRFLIKSNAKGKWPWAVQRRAPTQQGAESKL